jgi:hypothetical protein
MIHVWLNIAILLAIVGAAVYASCLSSTTFWGDE